MVTMVDEAVGYAEIKDVTVAVACGQGLVDGRTGSPGNSMFLDYTLRIPWNDGTLDLRIDDRMYLVHPDVLINESKMKKFGFGVGEILLVIRRVEPAPTSP